MWGGGGGGELVQWLKLPAWKVGDRGFELRSGIQIPKKQNISSLLIRKRFNTVGSLRDRGVASSASDRKGLNFEHHQGSIFESCVWKAVSSHSSHHPQEVLLAQFSLYVHPIQFIFYTMQVAVYSALDTCTLILSAMSMNNALPQHPQHTSLNQDPVVAVM